VKYTAWKTAKLAWSYHKLFTFYFNKQAALEHDEALVTLLMGVRHIVHPPFT